jgi:uncharacterized membrane protein (GlpM family)
MGRDVERKGFFLSLRRQAGLVPLFPTMSLVSSVSAAADCT